MQDSMIRNAFIISGVLSILIAIYFIYIAYEGHKKEFTKGYIAQQLLFSLALIILGVMLLKIRTDIIIFVIVVFLFYIGSYVFKHWK